jgi:multiple sugar transport system ATP-binding protein
MKDGFVQQVGTPQEVFTHPANVFVAGFIGTPQMNFFDARLDNENDLYVAGALISLPEKAKAALKSSNVRSTDVILGVRPEHITLVQPGTDNAVEAVVDVSEMMGSEVYVHLTACERDCVVRVATTELPVEHNNGFVLGERVGLILNGALVHIFAKETGANIVL